MERIDNALAGGEGSTVVAPDGTVVTVGWRTVGASDEDSGWEEPVAWRSTDGRAWAEVAMPLPAGSPDFPGGLAFDVAFGPGGFVAIGSTFDERALIWTSPTGESWARVLDRPRPVGVILLTIVTTSDGYVAVGVRSIEERTDAIAWVSPDGTSWTQEVIDTRGDGVEAREAVVRPDGSVLAVGDRWDDNDGEESSTYSVRIWTNEGGTWTRMRSDLGGRARYVYGLSRVADHYLLDVAEGTFASTDALSWQRYEALDGWSRAFATTEWYIITFCPGAVLTSPDGLTWTATPEPLFANGWPYDVAVLPDGRLLVVGAADDDGRGIARWIGTPE